MTDTLTILVLGPMTPHPGDRIENASRTRELRELIKNITDTMKSTPGYKGRDIFVDCPDDNLAGTIIPGILRKIEQCELVVVDLTGQSPNVAYEIGLIHALGLPKIFVTSDPDVPFYFRVDFHVAGFDLAPEFDPTRAGHAALRDRLLKFLADPEASAKDFAANQVTTFFEGLPIIDISGPVGIAAGYWINSIRRFVRQGGYFDAPQRKYRWEKRGGAAADGDQPLPTGGFVAVRPPGTLMVSFDDDKSKLASALGAHGLRTCSATIMPHDARDIRPFGGDFLARLQPDGTGVLIEPAIVVEIPTTLYALQAAPRIMRIGKEALSGTPLEARNRLKRMHYGDMIKRFSNVMEYYLSEAREHESASGTDRFHFVSLDQLPDKLHELGVLPS